MDNFLNQYEIFFYFTNKYSDTFLNYYIKETAAMFMISRNLLLPLH